ncbi:MAG: hypothetical protein IJT82_00755 [Schwartzia sp.]|nr:hypothetical protein [Schwartzia sp. (in: firmicutes)]
MNRSNKTAMQIVMAIAIMAVMSVAAYYGGIKLATAIVRENANIKLTLAQWREPYFQLVVAMGIISAVMLIGWHVLAHFVFSVISPLGVGKRPIWAIMLAVTVILCVAVPYGFSMMKYYLKMAPAIPAMFVGLYGIVGFWLGSIFVTPDNYKYTPIGSMAIRGKKSGK